MCSITEDDLPNTSKKIWKLHLTAASSHSPYPIRLAVSRVSVYQHAPGVPIKALYKHQSTPPVTTMGSHVKTCWCATIPGSTTLPCLCGAMVTICLGCRCLLGHSLARCLQYTQLVEENFDSGAEVVEMENGLPKGGRYNYISN